MPTDAFYRAQRSFPPEFCRLVEDTFQTDYDRAQEYASANHVGNQNHHRGTVLWGYTDDSLYRVAGICGVPVNRAKAANGQVHTEVYPDGFVLVTSKGLEPGELRTAKYRTEWARINSEPDPSLFDDPEQLMLSEDRDDRTFAVLQHVPYTDSRGKLFAVYVVIPDEEGDVLDYFRLDNLHRDAGTDDGGIEVIPDNVGPTPRIGGRKAAAK